MSKGGIPHGWLDYTAVGVQIASTAFVPFKVPLKESICNRLPSPERFTPLKLMQQISNLGLVIDLTNTFRYYDPCVFTSQNIDYVKLKCQGHGQVPGDDLTRQFFAAVDDFLAKDDTGKLIGVHCTHGLNRTGYFICKYMIDRMGFTPCDAIKKFETARGHKIEREMYINALVPQRSVQREVNGSRRWTRNTHQSNRARWQSLCFANSPQAYFSDNWREHDEYESRWQPSYSSADYMAYGSNERVMRCRWYFPGYRQPQNERMPCIPPAYGPRSWHHQDWIRGSRR